MHAVLHLVLAFDRFLPPDRTDETAWGRLGAYLRTHPGILLTLITALPLRGARRFLGSVSGLNPHSWITENGLAVHIRRGDGTYQEDRGYSLAAHAVLNENPRAALPGLRALAVTYLEAIGEAPRPRVIVGHPEGDGEILRIADHTVICPKTHSPLDSLSESLLRVLGRVLKRGWAWSEIASLDSVSRHISHRRAFSYHRHECELALEGRQP